jgi:hypothetical protein
MVNVGGGSARRVCRWPVGTRCPAITARWRRHWPDVRYVRPVFADPPAIRRRLDTPNAIERLHESLPRQLRTILKILTSRGHCPTDEAATTWLSLALRHILHTWHAAPTPGTRPYPTSVAYSQNASRTTPDHPRTAAHTKLLTRPRQLPTGRLRMARQHPPPPTRHPPPVSRRPTLASRRPTLASRRPQPTRGHPHPVSGHPRPARRRPQPTT